MGKSPKLSFTIKNTAKTVLYGDVDGSTLPPTLSVTFGAGSFALGRNKVHKVTVQALPNEVGAFSGTINIHSGYAKHPMVSLTAKGRGKK